MRGNLRADNSRSLGLPKPLRSGRPAYALKASFVAVTARIKEPPSSTVFLGMPARLQCLASGRPAHRLQVVVEFRSLLLAESTRRVSPLQTQEARHGGHLADFTLAPRSAGRWNDLIADAVWDTL